MQSLPCSESKRYTRLKNFLKALCKKFARNISVQKIYKYIFNKFKFIHLVYSINYTDPSNSSRLKSKQPIWEKILCESSLEDIWRDRCSTSGVKNAELMSDPRQRVPGFDLPKSLWTTLNRIRTEKDKCQYLQMASQRNTKL